MILGIFFCLYMVTGIAVAVIIADMNHHKRPGIGDWAFGIAWLPILLLLLFVHWKYKVSS